MSRRLWRIPVDEARPWATPWETRDGRSTTFGRMDRQHRLNLLAMLDREARRLKVGYELEVFSGPGPSGDGASLAYERELEDLIALDPVEWIRCLPAVRALRAITPDGPGPSPRRWESRLRALRGSNAHAFLDWIGAPA